MGALCAIAIVLPGGRPPGRGCKTMGLRGVVLFLGLLLASGPGLSVSGLGLGVVQQSKKTAASASSTELNGARRGLAEYNPEVPILRHRKLAGGPYLDVLGRPQVDAHAEASHGPQHRPLSIPLSCCLLLVRFL